MNMGKFCPVCGEPRPRPLWKTLRRKRFQRFKCDECGAEFAIDTRTILFAIVTPV